MTIKWSAFPAGSAIADANITVGLQSGANVQWTWTQVRTYLLGTSTSTLSIAAGKTLTVSNTLTFTGTDASSVAFGTGGTVLYTSSTIPLTVGSTTIASGTSTRILYDNAGVVGEYTISGSGTVVAMVTSPSFTTPTLGVATATSINKVALTAPATSATLTIADGKTLTSSVTMTLQGGDASILSIAAAKTLTASNTLTFTGTDGSSVAFGAGGTVLYTASTIPLTVGSTTIASGTNTRILYNNSGVLGEYTLTGTGTVVAMQTAPSFLTSITTPIATITQGTITGDAPQINGTVTWNSGGVTFTGWKLNVTDTASAAASLLMDLQVGGSFAFRVRKDGQILAPFVGFANGLGGSILAYLQADTAGTVKLFDGIGGDSATFGIGSNLILARDAANILAQRNGTSAQAFNVYNTFTDASNYERLTIDWGETAGRVAIGPEWAGTGTAKNLYFRIASGAYAYFQTDGAVQFGKDGDGGFWNISSAGKLLAETDNTYDIGASGATRPRDLYLARSFAIEATVTAGGTTGNQTINKAAGTVNFAATDTAITVTNSLVTANSIILCALRTNDATARIANVVPGAGTFTINLTAAATAETSVGFFVVQPD